MKTHLFDHVPAVRTCLVVFLTVTFFVTSLGLENIVYADEGTGMVALSRPTESVMLTGIKTFPGEPFRLDFLIDEGDRHLSSKERGAEAMRLIKYFMAALTVPESDLWVNLSPYEKDRVIAPGFGKTDMGSDMLAQDYLLKRLSASLTYPKGNLGEDYWRQLRAEMSDRFGSADRTVETMHRIWIVPDIADVVVADGAACIAKTKLKVMMEKDYLASEDAVSAVTGSSKNAGRSESKDLSADVYRRVLLPSVEHEVNDGAHFKELRQMYNALILATWYKRHLKETVLAGLYADKNKVGGIDDADADAKDKIYAEYLASFKKGVYELIKAERDPQTQKTVHRQYFSGGIVLDAGRVYRETADLSEMTKKAVRRDAGRTYRVSSALLTKEQGAALLSVPQAETATAEPQKVSLVPLDAVATLAGGIGFWLATANPIVTVLGALAATVIMRVGMTGAYAFHEWMHIVLAGKKTLTRENLRANVSLHDWAGMLVPFFGKVPQGLKVKAEGLSRMKAGLNRAGTMAATAAVTGVGAAATVAAAHGGDAMTAAALLPAVLGTAWVTLNALWSDVLKPALGKSTDGELECGIGMYMMRKDKNDVGLFPERAMKGMRGVFDTTVVRGHQAAGLLSEGEDKNGVHLVGVKTVNEKRGNLPEILERKFEKSVERTAAGMHQVEETDYVIGFFHSRFSTSGPSSEEETHPHQWMDARFAKVWRIGNDGRLHEQTRNLQTAIIHNGDFDDWLMDGEYRTNDEIKFWLERVLDTPSDLKGDSPKLAGMMDFLITKGMWDASVRYAYYTAVKPNIGDVFGGHWDVGEKWRMVNPKPTSPEDYYLYFPGKSKEMFEKNRALPQAIMARITKIFEEEFERNHDLLVFKEAKDLSDLWVDDAFKAKFPAKTASQTEALRAFKARLFERVSRADELGSVSQVALHAFVDAATEGFFTHDAFTAVKKFFSNAKGAFGLGVMTTVEPGTLIAASDGQPLAIGWDDAHDHIITASEYAAVKGLVFGPNGKEKRLDRRLGLKQETGKGEIAKIKGGKIEIFSRETGKQEMVEELKEEKRILPLKNNPYISVHEAPSKDPTQSGLDETPEVLQAIRDSWKQKDSLNRQSAEEMLKQLLTKKIVAEIKEESLAYLSVNKKIRDYAVKLADETRAVFNADPQLVHLAPQAESLLARLEQLYESEMHRYYNALGVERPAYARASKMADLLISGKMTSEQAKREVKNFVADVFDRFIAGQLADGVKTSVMFSDAKRWEARAVAMFKRQVYEQGKGGADAAETTWAQIRKEMRDRGVSEYVLGKPKAADMVITGLENSQWVGEAFQNSLKKVFPSLNVVAASSNKVVGDVDSPEIDAHTIVLAISQSGQTHPTLNATYRLEELAPGRTFVLTGEVDSLMGEAVGQAYDAEAPFCRHIFTNMAGRRASEVVSVPSPAMHATLTELTMRLGEDMLKIYPYSHPFGSSFEQEDFVTMQHAADETIGRISEIVGVGVDGKKKQSKVHANLLSVAKRAANQVLDMPMAEIFPRVNLYMSLVFAGISPLLPPPVFLMAMGGLTATTLFATLVTAKIFREKTDVKKPLFSRVKKAALLVGAAAAFSFVPWLPLFLPVQGGLFIAAKLFASLLHAGQYDAFRWVQTVLFRTVQNRDPRARMGTRTFVIGDPSSWVHQSMRIYAEKLTALSYGVTTYVVDSGNNADHFVPRAAHKVVRGTEIVMGFLPDNKKSQTLERKQDAAMMASKQSHSIQNKVMGKMVGAEVIGFGPKRAPNRNATDIDIALPESTVEAKDDAMAQMLADRFDTMVRLVAMQKFFHSMVKNISVGPWKYPYNSSTSGTAVQTTRTMKPKPSTAEKNGSEGDPDEKTDGAAMSASSAVAQKKHVSAARRGADDPAYGGIDFSKPRLTILDTDGVEAVHGARTATATVEIDQAYLDAMPKGMFKPVITGISSSGVEAFLR